jgi:hypothetical protein
VMAFLVLLLADLSADTNQKGIFLPRILVNLSTTRT